MLQNYHWIRVVSISPKTDGLKIVAYLRLVFFVLNKYVLIKDKIYLFS